MTATAETPATDADEGRRRWRRPWPGRRAGEPAPPGARRGLARLLPLVVAVSFALTGAAWAVSSPAGSSPDDDFHLSSIWCAWGAESGRCEAPGGGELHGEGVLVPGTVVRSPCYAYVATESAQCSYQLTDGLVPARANSGGYPGLFYVAMHVFVQDDVPVAVVTMRLANVLLCAVLLGACLSLAGPRIGPAVALSWLVTLVPLTIFVVASTNPSSWVLTGLGTYWAFLLEFFTAQTRRRMVVTGALAALAAVLAAGARADGAAFLLPITAVVALLGLPLRLATLRNLRLLLPAAVCLGGLAVFVTTGQSSALGGLSVVPGEPVDGGLPLLLRNLFDYPTLLGGIYGQSFGLGWLDTLMPPAVATLGVAALFGVLLVAAPTIRGRALVGAAALTVLLVALPLYILQQGGDHVGANVQPRYVLPLVLVAVGVALVGQGHARDPAWKLGRSRVALLVIVVAAAHVMALESELRRYVTGVDVSSLDLDAGREWWWATSVGPTAVWLGGSLTALVLVWALATTGGLRRATTDVEPTDA